MAPHPPLFRPETFNLLGGEFATNLSYYRNYAEDDALAGMFLGCALDIIDCTYYTFAKFLPADKKKIAGSFFLGWQDDVFGTHPLDDIFDPGLAREVVDQHRIILDAMREKYQWLVRGTRDFCWKESMSGITAGMDSCRSQSRCHDEGAHATDLKSRCGSYFAAWRGTMLAIDDLEVFRSDTAALSEEIRSRCRVLALLTTPEGLSEFLNRGYGQDRPEEDMRTVRGLITRLLTMLVDESLANLNRRLNLPPEEALYFSTTQIY